MYERISYLYKLLKNNRLGFKNLMINVVELLKKNNGTVFVLC